MKVTCVADVVRPNVLPGVEEDKSYVLVGLHCCGDLSSVLCELSVTVPQVVGIVLVPCCYHHLSERSDFEEEIRLKNISSQFETGLARGLKAEELCSTEEQNAGQFIGFPLSEFCRERNVLLGRNARMLSCHSRRRIEASFHPDRDVRSTKVGLRYDHYHNFISIFILIILQNIIYIN